MELFQLTAQTSQLLTVSSINCFERIYFVSHFFYRWYLKVKIGEKILWGEVKRHLDSLQAVWDTVGLRCHWGLLWFIYLLIAYHISQSIDQLKIDVKDFQKPPK